MRRVCGLLLFFAGCSAPGDYRPGPPMTVREPIYSGPVVSPPRPGSVPSYAAPQAVTPAPPTAPTPPVAMAPPPWEPMDPPGTRFMNWLRSGRGWTWGAANRGPIRDEGLDRLMVDTLTSSTPGISEEPIAPVNVYPSDVWVYPQ